MNLRARMITVALCAALALIGPAAASAATWSVTTLVDDEVGGALFGISCPTVSLCVATGADSLVATSTNPTGGPSAWRVVHPGGSNELENVNPGGGGVLYLGDQIRGISCVSVSLCVGVALNDRVFSSTNPAGGDGAWKVVSLSGEKEPHTHMTGVSCPTLSLCVAVAYGGKVVTSTDPAGDASAWTKVDLPFAVDLRGISCPTASFCAAVDNEGRIVTSTNPLGGPGAWKLVGAPAGAGSLNGISCSSPDFCVTANADQFITSTNPTGGVAAWRAVSAGTGLPVKGVSCPAVSACAAVDNNSDALTSSDPTSANWAFTNVIPAPLSAKGSGQNGMFGISCPSASLCVAAGASEQIISSTDPFAPDPVEAVSRDSGRLGVVITRHPAKRVTPRKRGNTVSFRFHAVGGRATRFACKLSGRGVHRLKRQRRKAGQPKSLPHRAFAQASPSRLRLRRNHHRRARFSSCRSPVRYRVGRGSHVFRVRAFTRGGRRSRPATFHFRVSHLSEEPPTGSCPATTSTRLLPPGSHPCINARFSRTRKGAAQGVLRSDAGGGTRTPDTRIMIPLL